MTELSGGQQQRVALARALAPVAPRPAARRAALEPRPVAAREDAAGAEAGDPPGRDHDPLRDARAGGGVRARRPRRGPERGAPRAGRNAGGALRAARDPLRRDLHRALERRPGAGGSTGRAAAAAARLAGDRGRPGRARTRTADLVVRPEALSSRRGRAPTRSRARSSSAATPAGRRTSWSRREAAGEVEVLAPPPPPRRRRPRPRRPGAGGPGAARLPRREPRVKPRRGAGAARRPASLLLLFWLVGYPLLLTLARRSARRAAPSPISPSSPAGPAEWQALWASLWISLATWSLVGRRSACRSPSSSSAPSSRAGAPWARSSRCRSRCRRSSASSRFSFSTARAASRRARSRPSLAARAPPWRLSGPAAILLVHAYSMYVYFYLFTRAGLARLDAALPRGRREPRRGARAHGARASTLPLLSPALSGRGAAHVHDVARLLLGARTSSAAASG